MTKTMSDSKNKMMAVVAKVRQECTVGHAMFIHQHGPLIVFDPIQERSYLYVLF
tara:strand:- start:357 stop:518 length:162 start_codon:yes stop_codon:yes gene_type:complete